MRLEINDEDKIDVFAQEGDLCLDCYNAPVCPLVIALREEVAILKYSEIEISSCMLYISVSEEYDDLDRMWGL